MFQTLLNALISMAKTYKIFKRNKVPPDIKCIAVLRYALSSSYRKIALELNVSKSSVHEWTQKIIKVLKKGITIVPVKSGTIAVDETVIKINGTKFYLYAAVDVETNMVVYMRVYPTRNILTTVDFFKKISRRIRIDGVIVDRGPWYAPALSYLGLTWIHMTHGPRNLIESVFSSFKQRVRIFNCNITVRRDSLSGIKRWGMFCVLFVLYYNVMRHL